MDKSPDEVSAAAANNQEQFDNTKTDFEIDDDEEMQ